MMDDPDTHQFLQLLGERRPAQRPDERRSTCSACGPKPILSPLPTRWRRRWVTTTATPRDVPKSGNRCRCRKRVALQIPIRPTGRARGLHVIIENPQEQPIAPSFNGRSDWAMADPFGMLGNHMFSANPPSLPSGWPDLLTYGRPSTGLGFGACGRGSWMPHKGSGADPAGRVPP
jgi:hypothetical protein